MKKLLIAAVATAGLLTGCATMDEDMVVDRNTALYDTDGDGLFERAEYSAFGDSNFGVFDRNRDGWIDRNEFGIGWNAMGWGNDDGIFDAFDNDNNSYLSNDEFFGDDDFGIWDSNRDGFLDDDEWGV